MLALASKRPARVPKSKIIPACTTRERHGLALACWTTTASRGQSISTMIGPLCGLRHAMWAQIRKAARRSLQALRCLPLKPQDKLAGIKTRAADNTCVVDRRNQRRPLPRGALMIPSLYLRNFCTPKLSLCQASCRRLRKPTLSMDSAFSSWSATSKLITTTVASRDYTR